MMADNATSSSSTLHIQASTKRGAVDMVNNECRSNPAAQVCHLKSSRISSTNGVVNGKEASKAKNDTAQWVERSFKDKTREGIVKINKPCQEIPS